MRRGLQLGAIALAFVVFAAAPAYAHGADAPIATNFRVAITSTPDLPGLSVRSIEAGARLQLTNHSGQKVEVLGYQGEPYVEVRPDGVYENANSPATYLNVTIAHVDPPAFADPTAAPSWRKVSSEPVYRWHDQRALPTTPPADPEVAQHIRDWTVPLRVGTTPLSVSGTISWVPPPSAFFWWIATALGAALVTLICGPWLRVRATGILAGVVACAGLAALVYGVARELDAGYRTLGPIVGQLFAAQLWSTITALAAIAAAIYAFTGRESTFALALGGAAVGLFAGVVNAAVFHRSVTPVPWDADVARVVIAVVIAFGAGAALAATAHLRRSAQFDGTERARSKFGGETSDPIGTMGG